MKQSKDNIEDIYPLSPLQQGMLFHGLLDPGSGMYFQRAHWQVDGELDDAALERAWQATVDRHPILRTAFLADRGKQPLQLVRRAVRLPFLRHDLTGLPGTERAAALAEVLHADQFKGFDFARAPLMRVLLVRTGTATHHLVWSFHHLLLDGWSVSTVLGEVFGRYADPTAPRPAPIRPYREYISWLGRQSLDAAEAYWRTSLAGFDAATPLPVLRPAEDPDLAAPDEPGSRQVAVPPATSTALFELARKRRLTVNTVAQAAWALLLARYSGRDDVLFGTTVSGRPAELPGVEEMVGLFINTLPVRVNTDGAQRVGDWLSRIQLNQAELRQYEHSPLAQVRGWSEVQAGEPLFETLFVFENYPVDTGGADGGEAPLQLTAVANREHTNYPLSVAVVVGDGLALDVSFDRRRIDDPALDRLVGHYVHLLGTLPGALDATLAELSALTAAERDTVVHIWNPQPPPAAGPVLPERVAARARSTPDAVALVDGDNLLTWAQLADRVDRLARHLRGLGVGQDDLVALHASRSAALIAGMLAVQTAGAAYLALDVSAPAERNRFVLADAGVRLLLVPAGTPHPGGPTTKVVALDDPDTWTADGGTGDVSSTDLAYAIYTSGSTGRPKGTLISHDALRHYVDAAQTRYALTAADRIVQFSSPAFDASVDEIFTALSAGASLLVPDPAAASDPRELLRSVVDAGATVLMVPTAYWHEMVASADAIPAGLRAIVIGGEQALPAAVARWSALPGAADCALFNAYGPTEVTVGCTLAELTAADGDTGRVRVPVGPALPNSQVYVLDPALRPVPVGVVGEICAAGPSLARGYLNRPGLTATRFVAHPFVPGARLYRTGDLGRFRADGSVEVVGRADRQVKIRGFRVELGEVEAALATHPGVGETVVVARGDGMDKRLVGYVVPAARPIGAGDLRTHLTRILPDYLVPSAFVVLDALPRTTAGKVDRKALPAPAGARPSLCAVFTAPRTPAERILASVWCDVLGLDQVGVHDNFFELGGDSILSIQVVARARKLGLGLSPKLIFEHQTIAALAPVSNLAAAPAEQGPVTGEAPLTPIQRWFHGLDLPDRHHWNQSALLDVTGLDPSRLDVAVRAVFAHHDALRLRSDGTRQWLVAPDDTTGVEHAGSAAEVQASLDPYAGPVARFARTAPDRLLIVVHHMAIDAVSWPILLEDLATAYAGDPLPPKTTSVKEWATRLGGAADPAEDAHWKAIPATELPVDHPDGDNTVSSARQVTVELDEADTRALLTAVPAVYRTEINDVLLTALARALSSWTGAPTVTVALESHGREHLFDDVDLTRTVGWFTTLYPVALAPGSGDPGAALRAVKEQLRAVPRRGIGYGLTRDLPAPPTGISFNYLGQVDAGTAARLDGVLSIVDGDTGTEVAATGRRPFAIEIDSAVARGRLAVIWTYSENLHERASVARVAEAFIAALRAVIAHCTTPGAGGLTPSDVALARLDQTTLDRLTGGDRTVDDVYPLTPLQHGMLFHSLSDLDGGTYVEQAHWRIDGPLDLDRMRAAWQFAVDRHPVLRTAIDWDTTDRPLQTTHRGVPVPFAVTDLRCLDPAAREKRIADLVEADRSAGFDLRSAPLLRLNVICCGDSSYELLWTFHHALLDGWSVTAVLGDVFGRYQQPDWTPENDVRPYRDYVGWLGGQDLAAAETYWRAALAGFTRATPLASARPGTSGASGLGRWHGVVPSATTAALGRLARARGLTVNTLAQAAWGLLLSRLSGSADVVFGTTVSGRPADLAGVEDMVGLFINTLPVRVRVDDGEPVGDWLRRLQAEQAQARQFEYSPLADVQRWSDVPAGKPLFESLFVFENFPLGSTPEFAERGELEMSAVSGDEHTNYPLTMVAIPGDGIALQASYDRAHLGDEDARVICRAYLAVLDALCAGIGGPVGALSAIGAEDRLVLAGCNRTAVETRFTPVPALIAAVAADRPDAVAVRYADQSLTYAELDIRANRLAHLLRARGATEGAPVGVCLARSLYVPVVLLAVFRAGAAYVPLDPAYPADRIAVMVEDAGVSVVVGTGAIAGVDVIAPDDPAADGRPGTNPGVTLTPDDAAYVIFTSGSTGRPKGVLVTHGNLANLVQGVGGQYGFGPDDVWSVFHSFGFDVSVWELWTGLGRGGTVVVVPSEAMRAPDQLWDLIVRHEVTVLSLTPSVFAGLAQVAEPARSVLRWVVFGGEALETVHVATWQRAAAGAGPELRNMYGITETTVHVTNAPVLPVAELGPGGRPAVGGPIANYTVHVLDDRLEPVPVGAVGEICVGGAGVARGYVGRPGLTAQRFVADPFGGAPGTTLYRSGDLGRRRTDGVLEYIGRADQQVKIRGFRVELGEVEAAVGAHPAVSGVAVVARDHRLVAYVTAEAMPSVAELREHVGAIVPAHMVPAVFVPMDALPLTGNGKVDRRALPEPGDETRLGPDTPYVAPNGPVEQALAEIWAEVLGVERVGVRDNFFELGGDSILSIQVVARAGRRGIGISPKLVFDHQTVADLAAHTKVSATVAEQGVVTGHAPLLPIQRWFHRLGRPNPHHFNQSVLLDVTGSDVDRLDAAVKQLLAHHDALRLRSDGVRQWFTAPDGAGLGRDLTADRAQASLHLTGGPVARFALVAPDRLLVAVHHMAVDGVSWRILLEDLATAYAGLPLPPKTTSYKEWARRIGSLADPAEDAYWESVPRVTLPLDHPDGANTVLSTDLVAASLAADETRALLTEVPKAYRTRIDDVLLTALAQAVAAWTGQDAVTVAVEGHGREDVFDDVDLTRTVGWFTTLYPIALRPGTGDPGEALKTVKEQIRAVPRRGIGFHGDDLRTPIVFNYLGQVDQGVAVGPFTPVAEQAGAIADAGGDRAHVLDVSADVRDGRLTVAVAYSAGLHERATVETFTADLLTRLRTLIAHCVAPGTGGLTPSDVALARMDQAALDSLVAGDRTVEDVYPLSPLQQGMVFHGLADPDSAAYIEQVHWLLHGELAAERLRAAWQSAVDRHTALRAGIRLDAGGRPLQVVHRDVRVELRRHDVDGTDPAAVEAVLAADRERGYDLRTAPLMRLHLVPAGPSTHHLIWSFHHLLLDGWSTAMVLGEVFDHYAGQVAKPATVRPYRDFIAWLSEQDMATAERFWRDTLAGFTERTPLGVDRPSVVGGPEREPAEYTVRVPIAGLSGFAQRSGLTLNTLAQAAWALLLSRYSGRRDVVFGVTTSGRPPQIPGIEKMVGLFINTLPCRVQLNRGAAVLDWLSGLQTDQATVRQYEYTPLADVQRWSELPAGAALFESLFIFESFPAGSAAATEDKAADLGLLPVRTREQTNYPLTVVAVPGADELTVSFCHDPSRFDADDVRRMAGHYLRALTGLAAAELLDDVAMLDDDERRELVAAAAGPARPAVTGTLAGLLAERVRAAPDGVAVVAGAETLTFAQLGELAGRLARRLHSLGVRPGDPVGAGVTRGADAVVAFVGIVAAGAAYVPLDPAYPAAQRDTMLAGIGTDVLVTDVPDRFTGFPGTFVAVRPSAPDAPVSLPAPASSDVAYVIHTSGSTGAPKGVQVEHCNAVTLAATLIEWADPSAGRRVTLMASLSFDASVQQLLLMLGGATLHVLPDDLRRDAAACVTYLRQAGVDLVDCTPTQLTALLDAGLTGVEVWVGGEAIRPDLWRRLAEHPGIRAVNLYGPTEVTVDSTLRDIDIDIDSDLPSIGRPVPGAIAYVLDDRLAPVPIGVVGELYLGGAGVARGYAGRPARTAERFIADPYGVTGTRLYRTGDLVRRRANGELLFIGRADGQVKVRGYRLELGEIEAALAAHPDVTGAGATIHDGRLVGYHTGTAGVDALREHLHRVLPAHAVPALLVPLPALPVSSGGKLDRAALPAPAGLRPELNVAYAAPRGPVETALAEVWADVLDLDRVGRDDNFFALGGDSIRTIAVVTRAARQGVTVTPRRLFDHQSVAELAAVAGGGGTPGRAVEPWSLAGLDEARRAELILTGAVDAYPLSPLQQGMLFHGLAAPDDGMFVEQIHWRLDGALDIGRLRDCWDAVVRRHDVLRTAIRIAADAAPLQVVYEPVALPFTVHGLGTAATIQELLDADRRRGFDVAVPPLMRIRLVRTGPDTHHLLWSFHHLLLDGWSVTAVLQEVFARYLGAADERAVRPFRDYIGYLAAQDLAATETYWREKLSGFDAPTSLGVDRPAEGPAGPLGESEGELSPAESAALVQMARERRLTLGTVALGAWALLLARYSGDDDVLFGTTIAGRPAALDGVEDMIGLFMNTLPVRVGVGTAEPVGAWLERLQLDQARMREYEHSPLAAVQRWSDVPAGEPLFESLFVFENVPAGTPPPNTDGPAGALTLSAEGMRENINYPLSIAINDDDVLRCHLYYDPRRFTADAVSRLTGHYLRLLAAVAARPDAPLATLRVTTSEERRHALTIGRGPDADRPAPVPDVLDERADRHPDAVALVDSVDGAETTYRHLHDRVNRVARHLRDRGVTTGTPVGVCLERGPDWVVALLAVLRAGGVYVPLDSRYPRERLELLVADTGVELVLTGRLTDVRPAGPATVTVAAAEEAGHSGPSPQPLTPDDLAYVMYTSGSSGVPKGVAIEHGGLANLIAADVAAFGLTADSRVLSFAPLGFDLSIQEVLMTFWAGGRLIVAPQDELLPDRGLADLLRTHRVTLLQMPPQAWGGLDPDTLPDLEVVLTGSDRVPAELVAAWPGRRVLNVYGSTEATADSSVHECCTDDTGAPPVGRPLHNTTLYVLDRDGEPVPPGVAGEICIGGAGVARGYLNQPGLTASRFVADQYAAEPGSRLFRTGDLGRWCPDGVLEFVGRADQQVKVRGFRIELGEVESALLTLSDVVEAVALVRDRRLIGYVVPDAAGFDAGSARATLRTRLPDHLVPAVVVPVDALPLLPSGKVDRRSLADPGGPTRLSAAPRTPTEELVAGAWSAVLGAPHIGVEDSFFDLGGDSITAIQLVAKLRDALGTELRLRDVFAAPTVAEQAALVQRTRESDVAPLIRADRNADLPVSFNQRRLWFIDQLHPGSSAYNTSLTMRLTGALDRTALRCAVDRVAARHEVLRTHYAVAGGQPIQVIAPASPIDWTENDDRAGVRAAVDAFVDAPFDLSTGPLFRVAVFAEAQDRHVLAMSMHHSVCDGWSLGVLMDEIGAFYADPDAALAPLPVQYADFAVWQRAHLAGDRLADRLASWRDRLAGVPTMVELPADRPRPPAASLRGAGHTFTVPIALAGAVTALGRARGATPFMTMLTAYAALLARWSGHDDLPIGVPIAGRDQPDTQALIGFFVNTLVLRCDLRGDPEFTEALDRVRDFTLRAYADQDTPVELLVEELAPARGLGHHPLFQVVFSLQNVPGGSATLPGLTLEPYDLPPSGTNFDLSLHMVATDAGFTGVLEYAEDLFNPETVAALADRFLGLLEAVVADPGTAISRLPILRAGEAADLAAWSRGETPELPGRGLAELVAEQAALRPDAVAVSDADRSYTYAELVSRAARLAHRLRGLGTAGESLVGVCVERSAELPVLLLAVLQAGGAYLPLDPHYPAAALRAALADARPVLVVTEPGLAPRFDADTPLLTLDDVERERIAGLPERPPATAPGALAYAMFTSGSTGRPKGVLVDQRAVVRLLHGQTYAAFGPGRSFLQLAPAAFDASTLEIWGALTHGARLVVAPPGVPTVTELRDLITAASPDLLWLTAPLFNVLVDTAPEALAGVTDVFTGGETLSVPHLRAAQAAVPRVRLHNGYGPTESTTFVTTYPIDPDLPAGTTAVPIGWALTNTETWVLDERLLPVPVGVPGELYVGGAGLARGYLNWPCLTASRFVAHPCAAGERLYRTGDRVRRRADGALEFLGRLDDQVKVRGFRIEPGEVEAALVTHPAIREAAVLAHGTGANRHLVAYLVPTGDLPTAADLRAHLARELPQQMIPAAYVPMAALPLTPSGKVDRRALTATGPAPASTAEYTAPRDAAEQVLATVWAAYLGADRVGVHDDFFDLGGHSLVAVRLVTGIEAAFRVRLGVREIFEHPTVARLAAHLATRGGGGPSTGRVLTFSRGPVRPRLVLIHPAGPSALPYLQLARDLGNDHTVVALQAPEMDGEVTRAGDAAGMAAEHADALRAFDAETGPVPTVLAGWSFGGTLAVETARHLRTVGYDVPLVALFDTAAPGALDDGELSTEDESLLNDPELPELVRDLVRRQLTAARTHRPDPYDGPVLLFVAGLEDDGRPLERAVSDATAWGPLLTGPVTEETVAAGHGTLLTGNNAGQVARVLRARLKTALTDNEGGTHASL